MQRNTWSLWRSNLPPTAQVRLGNRPIKSKRSTIATSGVASLAVGNLKLRHTGELCLIHNALRGVSEELILAISIVSTNTKLTVPVMKMRSSFFVVICTFASVLATPVAHTAGGKAEREILDPRNHSCDHTTTCCTDSYCKSYCTHGSGFLNCYRSKVGNMFFPIGTRSGMSRLTADQCVPRKTIPFGTCDCICSYGS